ncbi:MAG: AsmA family protein [bacterium]
MKKALRWLAIMVGVLILLLVVGMIALPFIFPLDKIKDFATTKISESIHREVKINKVSFNIFSGIKLEGLYVGNRSGFAKRPFISADSIDLHYAFWPLFSRQIIIKEISLVKPQILVEKNARGEFNFSDMIAKPSSPNASPVASAKRTSPPFDLFVTAFSIKNGKLSYVDNSTKTISEIKNLGVKISGFELALVKPINLKVSADVNYQGKDIPVSLAGKIGVNLAEESINIPSLALSIAGESLNATAKVSSWKVAPQINFSLNSGGFNVDPLLAIFAASAPAKKTKPVPGALTKTINQATASIPANVGVKGEVNVNNLTFQKFKVDKIGLSLSLARKVATASLREIKFSGGTLTGKAVVNLNTPGLGYEVSDLKLAGFDAHPFSNSVVETFLTTLPDYKDLIDKAYGTLDLSASLSGRGVEPNDIMANLNGEASLSLKNGELKRLKTLASVGQTLKSNTLQGDVKFGELTAAASISKKVVNVKTLKLDNQDFGLNFKGGVDLGRLVWVAGNRLTLKLSPANTKNLPQQFSLMRDDKGWLEITFELTGGLTKPFPKPILDKPIEAAVGKLKVKIEAKKVEIENQAKAEAQKKLDAEKARLQEEAKNKLKNLIKF